MNIKNIEELRINGYAVDAATGAVETRREPLPRWNHTHLGVISIDISDSKPARELIAAVVAAVEEPACLTGVSRTGPVLIFQIGGAYSYRVEPRDTEYGSPKAQHEFVFDGKPGALTISADSQLIDVAAFTWRNGRSPATVARSALPPIFADVSQRAFNAAGVFLRDHGHRWGPLVVPETDFEKRVREIAADRAAGIAENPIDEDEKIVAANPTLRMWDGTIGQIVSLARERLAARKATAEHQHGN